MFKEILKNMLGDVNSLKLNKDISSYINERLENSFQQYADCLNDSCDYILSRDNKKVMQTLNKENLKGDNNG